MSKEQIEDNVNIELYDNGIETSNEYKNQDSFKSSVIELFEGYFNSRREIFEVQLEKIKVEEEN